MKGLDVIRVILHHRHGRDADGFTQVLHRGVFVDVGQIGGFARCDLGAVENGAYDENDEEEDDDACDDPTDKRAYVFGCHKRPH